MKQEENRSGLTYLSVHELYPHPDNPRKDVGDVTELADSIKAKGIMQNLTVVRGRKLPDGTKDDNGYTVIIGHRRLAASIKAGLSVLPCVITEMDEKDQIATMLLENMQRSDLTIYEQAQGFQMMMDLGETIDSVAEKSGFSTSTIRRRVKLLDLDAAKFKAASERGATLMDYEKLDKIKDPELKNKVLEKIGTKDFEWALKNAISEEKQQERKALIMETVKSFAEEIENTTDKRWCFAYYEYGYGEINVPEDAAARKYYYNVSHGCVNIYRNYTAEEKRQSEQENLKRAEGDKIRNQFSEIAKRAYECRSEFVRGIHGKVLAAEIMKFACASLIKPENYFGRIITDKQICSFMNIPEDMQGTLLTEIKKGNIGTKDIPTEKLLLTVAYCNFYDSEREEYADFKNEHKQNATLDEIYNFLEMFGYQLSSEEQAWKDGTHELYKNTEAGNDDKTA